ANVSYTPPPATDAVDGLIAVACAPASGHAFPLGHTTVSCTAVDTAHNVTHSSFDVLVHDTTAPTIQAHADLVADASGPAGASVSYTAPSASDAVDGPVSVACAPASGSTFALGHTTVSCSATDAANNTTHSSFDVLVDDTTGPTIQAHADLVVDATGPAGASVSYTGPSASDAVDGPVSFVCAPVSGSPLSLGYTAVS